MRKFLSEEAKQVIIKKVLSDNGQTMTEIALANNIGKSTLSEWVQRFKIENNIEPNLKSQSDESRTLVERFMHLQLTQWEADFMTKTIPEKQRSGTAEVKALHAEINSLKNIILRKDKVLAETVALLVLKKMAAQIWGGNEED
jgi:transposase-like protein